MKKIIMLKMNNETYDFLKFITTIVLPAIAAFYKTLAPIWNLPYESAPGSVCNYYGIAFRIDPGMERKSVCQCVSSYGGKYLEPAGQ